jgi:hypothetical protein
MTSHNSMRKLWSSGRILGSGSEGRGFDPRPLLDGRGVKAMQGAGAWTFSLMLQKIDSPIVCWDVKKSITYIVNLKTQLLGIFQVL